MTPLYARTIAIQETEAYQMSLRRYLQCHIAGEIDFQAVRTSHSPGEDTSSSRHVNPEYAFDFEFHLSYVALRMAGAGGDPSAIREHVHMIEPFDARMGTAQDAVCYDAQTSFMIVGTDNENWKAYCNVNTWFKSEQSVDEYHKNGQDGPSGGVRLAEDPCWNPREYFLLVLSHRLRQASMEWGNVFTFLMARLDTYENRYQRTIEAADGLFREDQTMSRIRSYCKAASMLRQYHDTISTTLDRLESFLKENDDLFTDQRAFQDQCGCYRKIIDIETAHLSRWRRRLGERMQRFDTMRDGLQSRRATRQADQIGVLTNVTVVYLPFGLTAAILGVSTNIEQKVVWGVLVGLGLCLTVLTLCAIYWSGLWRRLRPRPRALAAT